MSPLLAVGSWAGETPWIRARRRARASAVVAAALAWLCAPLATSSGRSPMVSGTMAWQSRVPVMITRHRSGGATSEDVESSALPSKESLFRGESSARVLRLPCKLSTCKVSPEAVLRVLG